METDSKKQILLTGGSGFIGKNIIEQLSLKYNIFSPSETELNLLDDSSVEKLFKVRHFDYIIHTANIGAYSLEQKSDEISDKNIRMFLNLAKNLKPDQKMIFLGSGAEYDRRRDIVSISEDEFGKHIPEDSYGFAKYTCSKYIEKSENIINLRCFGVYGKYEQETRFISEAIIDSLSEKPIIIRQNAYIDYLYIDDLIKTIDHFISHKRRYKFYNATSEVKIDLITVAKLVKKITKNEKEIIVKEEGLSKEYTADSSRLKGGVNIEFTSIEEGIKKLTDYYKNKV